MVHRVPRRRHRLQRRSRIQRRYCGRVRPYLQYELCGGLRRGERRYLRGGGRHAAGCRQLRYAGDAQRPVYLCERPEHQSGRQDRSPGRQRQRAYQRHLSEERPRRRPVLLARPDRGRYLHHRRGRQLRHGGGQARRGRQRRALRPRRSQRRGFPGAEHRERDGSYL